MNVRVWVASLYVVNAALGQTLDLPNRELDAPGGSELVERLTPLLPEAREREILKQFSSGNVPQFLRQLCPVTVTNVTDGQPHTAMFHVTPDYLAVGSDADYFLTPLTPATAQRIADFAGCALPTRKMVNAIYAAAEVKLPPSPIPPGPLMTTVPEFAKHHNIVRTQRVATLQTAPLGALVAGHKKDVVVTARLAGTTNKVAIFGWHQTNGVPIQPFYLGHTAAWVDYSHGIRLVSQTVRVNGQPQAMAEVLAHPILSGLLSDEGPFTSWRYTTNTAASASPTAQPHSEPQTPRRGESYSANSSPRPPSTASAESRSLANFTPAPCFEEQRLSFTLDPGVRVHINAPTPLPATREVMLVFYALPNGNTIEQTIGKVTIPGDDWRFDIQHIGAQTRWLRQHVPERSIVVAYLEADTRSWPAWRKQHGDVGIPVLLDAVARIFRDFKVSRVLTGHSGGGSLTFGFLNAVEAIPDTVERIAFLDSNYAYDGDRHRDKLVAWLQASERRALCVLAYQDYVALLDGKPFVSERGGTWGRSHAMLEDLRRSFAFHSTTNALLATHCALGGRLQFRLRENPERKIYHTVQVERNGFIHALLAGTPADGKGYVYFGERAYGVFPCRD